MYWNHCKIVIYYDFNFSSCVIISKQMVFILFSSLFFDEGRADLADLIFDILKPKVRLLVDILFDLWHSETQSKATSGYLIWMLK